MDVMNQLTAIGMAPTASQDRLDAVRRRLLEEAEASGPSRPRRFRVPQRALTAVAACALVGGGSVALWAAVSRTSNPVTNTTIECGADTFIPVESGNPVLDCYNALARQESVVPALVGWVTPSGLVAVLPKGDRPPTGSTPLPASFQVDPGIRYITDSLNDAVGPLELGCLSTSAATAYARSQLSIAALSSWRVTVGNWDGPGSSAPCWSYVGAIDASSETVVLAPMPASSAQSDNLGVRLDLLLQSQLVTGPSARRLDAAAAQTTASDDAERLGIASDAITISDAGPIGAPGTTCATPFVVPAGYYDVVLWLAPRTP